MTGSGVNYEIMNTRMTQLVFLSWISTFGNNTVETSLEPDATKYISLTVAMLLNLAQAHSGKQGDILM